MRRLPASTSARQDGLTLVEIMIVVVIVAILAAIAYPSYLSVVTRNNRAVARSALSELASRETSYYTQHTRYAADLTPLGYPTSTIYLRDNGGLIPNNGGVPRGAIYLLRVNPSKTSNSPPKFQVEAQPVRIQSHDTDCQTLFINSEGTRDSTGGGDNCW